MKSRPLTASIAIIAAALLLLLWTLWPAPEEAGLASRAPGAVGDIAKKRHLRRPKPLAVPRRGGIEREEPASTQETAEGVANADEATPARQTRRERALAKRAGLARARATAAAAPRAPEPEPEPPVEEEPDDGAISGAPPEFEFEASPDSPFAGLTKPELLEYIVAMRRLRDSGALRRVSPEDYWRIMDIMPESRGLQDADRIMNEIFGMGIGEWLAQNRGPQTFGLE